MWYFFETAIVNLNDFPAIFKVCPGISYKNNDFEKYSIVFENNNLLKYFSYDSMEMCDSEFNKILKLLGLSEPDQISRCC